MKSIKLFAKLLLFSGSLLCMEDHPSADYGNLSGVKRKKTDNEIDQNNFSGQILNRFDVLSDELVEEVSLSGFNHDLMSLVCKRFNVT